MSLLFPTALQVAFDIACGKCWYCNNGYHSSCDVTNPSKVGTSECVL